MFSNCGTGTVPKITRRNILIGRDNIANNISNNLEPVNMDQPSYTDGSKSSDDPTISAPSKDTTSAGAMSSNLHQNQVDKKSSKNGEDIKYLDRRQVEDKLEQIREYISITTSLICNMRKTDEQNDPTPDDSERLERMVHELKDSEHKLIRILENWNQDVPIPLPEVKSDLQLEPSTSTLQMEDDYKDEAACLELQKPLVAEQENILQEPQLGFALNDNSRNNSANQVEAIQELEERLDTWNKAQMNRMNLQEHLESQVEMLGDTISHMRNDSDTRRDIMDILDQKDSTLQAEHFSLQNKLLELQTKKQQVDQLVEQLHVLNGPKSEDEDVGNQVRRIVSMKDQLSKLKDMLHSIQNIEDPASEVFIMENTPPESIEATLRIRNDVRNSTGRHLPGPLQEEANVHRHTQKQVNKQSTNSIDKQRSLQAELQAKKHELEELMSKRKATSNLNHDGNSEKSSLGMYNSIYNAYNHKEQYSSDEVSDDETNDFNTDLNLSIESLNKNQIPQHLIPERLSSVNSQQQQASTSQQQQQDCWSMENRQQQQMLVEDVERGQSEARKGIFVIDPSRQQESYRTQRMQMQKQLELIRNVCDTMLMESTVPPLETDTETFNNQPPQHLHQRKNHTPSPLYSEPLSYNNTCGTPDNQNQINVNQDQNNPMGVMSPMITTMSAGSSSKMAASRGRGNSMTVGAAGDHSEGMQAAHGTNSFNRCVKPTSSANPDQSSNVWQQQQQWLVSNTLQSQAFIMNTLNQCCQMMWLQQREIQSLRNAVQNMQLQQQNQSSNSSVSNNQQRFNQYSNLQGGVSSTPYINTSSTNSAFAYPVAGPSTASLQLPSTGRFPSNTDPNSCSGIQKSNPNLLGMLPNVNHSFPTSFGMVDTLDVNHTDFRTSSNAAAQQHVHRSNMTPMSDCLNNCSNNNLSNVNMNNVMHGGNNLASNSNPQIWHERSLNNQVNQGNSRANNYWDNFRR